ncbi:MAG: AAA domain-containing protein [Ardenticatenales bacterium]|nr:AAA domain-containing protein [Ardenticatenales bacterium]
MGTLNPKLLTPELDREMHAAGRIMRGYRKRVLTPEMLLLALVRRPGSAANQLLARLADQRGLKELEATVETMARMRGGRDVNLTFVDQDGKQISLSNEMTKVLDKGLDVAQAHNEIKTNSDHVLAAMADHGMTTSGVLHRHGVTPAAVAAALTTHSGAKRGTTVDYVALATEGGAEAVYERAALLQELIGLLSLAKDNHVILVGPPGVGKRSLVHSLALKIAQGNGPPGLKSLVQVSEPVLLDDPIKALQAGLRRAQGGILFIPHIQRFFGGPLDAEFPKASGPLRKALLDRGAAIIGTTNQAAYDKLMSKRTAVVEHTHRLRVPPTTPEETLAILRLHQPLLEQDYRLQIEDGALEAAASLAQRYLSATPLPGAAMHLIHRTAASLRAARLGREERLDPEDVTLTLSQMTGIPVSKLGADERTRYARMVEHLHQRIIGQQEAVMAVSRAVKTARVGLKDPKRPIGSFLFLGPTGVGKTELAKALAEFMFGDEDAATEIDMSEYQQEHSVNRLIGAPPGYVGYEGGGQLTDAVRERPYGVVLFDEVEKAHPRVTDILLQVMEEGRLTDGQGRTTLFYETVIILTSNLGSERLIDPAISQEQREWVMEEVKRHFRPEFLNRLDDIILFHPLSAEHLRLILELMLEKEKRLAAGSGIRLEVSKEAQAWLLAQNEHPEWGARPLRRILRRHLREPLADDLLKAPARTGATVRVEVQAGRLLFDIQDGAA